MDQRPCLFPSFYLAPIWCASSKDGRYLGSLVPAMCTSAHRLVAINPPDKIFIYPSLYPSRLFGHGKRCRSLFLSAYMQYCDPPDTPGAPRPTCAMKTIAWANISTPAPQKLISPRILSLHIHAALRSAPTRSRAHAFDVTVYQWAGPRMLSRQILTPKMSLSPCSASPSYLTPPAYRPIALRAQPCASAAHIFPFAVYCNPRAHRHITSSHRPPRPHPHSALDRPYVRFVDVQLRTRVQHTQRNHAPRSMDVQRGLLPFLDCV